MSSEKSGGKFLTGRNLSTLEGLLRTSPKDVVHGDREEGGHRFPKDSQELAPASCFPHFPNLSGISQTYIFPEMFETGAL